MKLYKTIFFKLLLCSSVVFAQHTQYVSIFDYKNINTTTFVNGSGFNDTLLHYYTILKHSFDIQKINSTVKDTTFVWNGLKGMKTHYTKDSLGLFFIRPNDNIIRPCILLTHGNNAMYSTHWSEQMNFTATDLAMRGYSVAYFENPSSTESKNKYITTDTRKLFYNGFQAAVAAAIYITQHATGLNIDTTQLFADGLSFGAFCALSLTLADKNNNFNDTLFANQGGFEAKSINGGSFRKNIKRVLSIGGGLPKADTILLNSSRMGEFLSENDNEKSLLFLHGKNDNLVLLNSTKFPYANTDSTYFFVEGPNIIVNNIKNKHLPIENKTFINCNGGHAFINSVCGNQNYNCIQQYQWGYLNEPPGTLSASSAYFTNKLNDTLLKYFTYMVSQIAEENFFTADFFKASFSTATTTFDQAAYFVQPNDTFSFHAPITFYKIKNTDCEGNEINTAIEETHSVKNDVNIYPNPTGSFIVFETKEDMLKIHIYSMLGVLVKEISINEVQQKIDVNNFANGEYLCVIQLKKESIVKKFSIIR